MHETISTFGQMAAAAGDKGWGKRKEKGVRREGEEGKRKGGGHILLTINEQLSLANELFL